MQFFPIQPINPSVLICCIAWHVFLGVGFLYSCPEQKISERSSPSCERNQGGAAAQKEREVAQLPVHIQRLLKKKKPASHFVGAPAVLLAIARRLCAQFSIFRRHVVGHRHIHNRLDSWLKPVHIGILTIDQSCHIFRQCYRLADDERLVRRRFISAEVCMSQ